jgi:hypothetical protein
MALMEYIKLEKKAIFEKHFSWTEHFVEKAKKKIKES